MPRLKPLLVVRVISPDSVILSAICKGTLDLLKARENTGPLRWASLAALAIIQRSMTIASCRLAVVSSIHMKPTVKRYIQVLNS